MNRRHSKRRKKPSNPVDRRPFLSVKIDFGDGRLFHRDVDRHCEADGAVAAAMAAVIDAVVFVRREVAS